MFNMLRTFEMSIVYNCFIISHDHTRSVSFMYLTLSLDLCCKNYTIKPQPTVLETKAGIENRLI